MHAASCKMSFKSLRVFGLCVFVCDVSVVFAERLKTLFCHLRAVDEVLLFVPLMGKP